MSAKREEPHTAAERTVEAAVADALPHGRWLLAVSGGCDSMSLLEACARVRRADIAAVATFDHGTGAAARRAVEMVERTAVAMELPVVSGSVAATSARTEAAWRDARWKFLRAWAAELQVGIVTGHTRDDQIETVFIRLLRESGVRGLAGMRAEFAGEDVIATHPRVARPLLSVGRADVAAYAEARGVRWVDDPSNDNRTYLRNRARHDLLPALERASPGFGAWLAELGERAGAWRADVESLVTAAFAPSLTPDGSVVVRASAVESLRAGEWMVAWPAIAARAGVAIDWRGLERASAWAPRAKVGSEIPLSGGARIVRTGSTFVVHPGKGASDGNDAGE